MLKNKKIPLKTEWDFFDTNNAIAVVCLILP